MTKKPIRTSSTCIEFIENEDGLRIRFDPDGYAAQKWVENLFEKMDKEKSIELGEPDKINPNTLNKIKSLSRIKDLSHEISFKDEEDE